MRRASGSGDEQAASSIFFIFFAGVALSAAGLAVYSVVYSEVTSTTAR